MRLPPSQARICYRLRRYLMQQAMPRIIKISWTTETRPLRDIRSVGNENISNVTSPLTKIDQWQWNFSLNCIDIGL